MLIVGAGMRHRQIECLREDGMPVPMAECDLNDLASQEPCEVTCVVDCELSRFTPWTTCTAECGPGAYKSRWMAVVTKANTWGRQCPSKQQLTQVKLSFDGL